MSNKYYVFIKFLRLQSGFSQLEIAEKLGISRSSYVAFEQGKRGLTLEEATELSNMFNISLEDIKITGRDILKSLYLKKIITETAITVAIMTHIAFLKNWFPNTGEIVSIFTMSNLTGNDPVIKTVCNLFIFFVASSIASSLVLNKPSTESMDASVKFSRS